jgi:hypothetical protein
MEDGGESKVQLVAGPIYENYAMQDYEWKSLIAQIQAGLNY